eukprot:UN11656
MITICLLSIVIYTSVSVDFNP